MLSLLRRPALACGARAARLAPRARGMCETVNVDMVCRVFSCKVADDATAHKLDCAFEDFLDAAAEVEGCAGASRLVCKTEWDYKLILKFEDVESLERYLSQARRPAPRTASLASLRGASRTKRAADPCAREPPPPPSTTSHESPHAARHSALRSTTILSRPSSCHRSASSL
jgi:hypothetical protein